MKKLLLILSFVSVAMAATAQRVDNFQELKTDNPFSLKAVPNPDVQMLRNKALNKTAVSAWYSFPQAVEDFTASVQAYAPYMFSDTTVVYGVTDQAGQFTELQWIRWNSFGACFDPNEEIYDLDNDPETVPMSQYNPYKVDSVGFFYLYGREIDTVDGAAVADTLVVQVFNNAAVGRWFFGPQEAPEERFGTVTYNIKTGLATGASQTIRIPLTIDDTTTSAFRFRTVGLSNFNVAANGIMAVTVTYKPGHPYSFGDTISKAWDPDPDSGINFFRFRMMVDNSNTILLSHNNGMFINFQQRHKSNWFLQETQSARYLPSTGWTTPQYPDVRFLVSSQNVGINELGSFNSGLSMYPNPVQGNARLAFSLSKADMVTVSVTDIAGKPINTAVSGQMQAGKQLVEISTDNLKAGMYLCTVNAGGAAKTIKFMVTK